MGCVIHDLPGLTLCEMGQWRGEHDMHERQHSTCEQLSLTVPNTFTVRGLHHILSVIMQH